MVRDPFVQEAPPDLEAVLSPFVDDDSRRMIEHLDEPRTASELSDRCNVPLSTAYRKLGRMVEATLLEEITEIRPGGQHTTRFRIDFEEVLVSVTDTNTLELSINRPARTADERLAYLWTEVKREV